MIPFNDLRPLRELLAEEVRAATERVFNGGWYILGPEVETFEAEFASYHGISHAIGVATGTDAIELALRAAGVGPGDEVITVAHTAVATVCAIERAGATPVLVDVDRDSFTMDPAAAEAAITPRTRAIVPVHLYGHPAEMQSIAALAQRHGLLLIEDCAQAHGARYRGQLVGTFGDLAAFSFYPTKNLGAYGDGGAVITRNDALATRLRRLRNYGQEQRYHAIERGMNSRLDELQAAILRVKLRHLDAHNERRREIASQYAGLLHTVEPPRCVPDASGIEHVFHLYVVRHPRRDELRAALHRRGIAPQVHYPVPVHLQPAYADLGYSRGSLPVTEHLSDQILSLPLFIGLSDEQVATVACAINQSIEELPYARAA
jgi:dTDP-4-amino-4,6-dideoxygalactose transaminase